MGEELLAALNVLIDYGNAGMPNKFLASMILDVYPPRDGETEAQAIGRMGDEVRDLFEGLMGAVWTDQDVM